VRFVRKQHSSSICLAAFWCSSQNENLSWYLLLIIAKAFIIFTQFVGHFHILGLVMIYNSYLVHYLLHFSKIKDTIQHTHIVPISLYQVNESIDFLSGIDILLVFTIYGTRTLNECYFIKIQNIRLIIS